MYTMEDVLNWVVYFSPLVIGNQLAKWNMVIEDAWQHLRRAVLHYVRASGTHTGWTTADVEAARVAAREHLREHANIMENTGILKLLTYNLRLAVVYLFRQEHYLGEVGAAMEMWVERAIQRLKGVARDTHVKNRPVEAIVNSICDDDALDDYCYKYPNMRKLDVFAVFAAKLFRKTAVSRATDPAAEDEDAPCYFLGAGRHLSPTTLPCNLRLQLDGLVSTYANVRPGDYEIMVYLRMSLDKEVMFSSQYMRTSKRISYHVSLSGTVSGFGEIGLPAGYPYARILAYYLVRNSATQQVVCRVARVVAYREVEDEYCAKQGVTVVDKQNGVELIVPCAAILTKAMFLDRPGSQHYHVMHLYHQIRTGSY
jgi:hypothetical protein